MHHQRPADRPEYFSDAVLAIATTLLATELPKPETETGLLQAIVKEWPSYAAFAASFLFICIAWSNHHNMFIYLPLKEDEVSAVITGSSFFNHLLTNFKSNFKHYGSCI